MTKSYRLRSQSAKTNATKENSHKCSKARKAYNADYPHASLFDHDQYNDASSLDCDETGEELDLVGEDELDLMENYHDRHNQDFQSDSDNDNRGDGDDDDDDSVVSNASSLAYEEDDDDNDADTATEGSRSMRNRRRRSKLVASTKGAHGKQKQQQRLKIEFKLIRLILKTLVNLIQSTVSQEFFTVDNRRQLKEYLEELSIGDKSEGLASVRLEEVVERDETCYLYYHMIVDHANLLPNPSSVRVEAEELGSQG